MEKDIQEIKVDLKALLLQGARHNVLLEQHEARSLALQAQQELLSAQLQPVQKHVDLVNTLSKVVGAVLVGVLVHWAVKLLTGP